MYKDIKNSGNKNRRKRTVGLEIIEVGDNNSLRKGVIIPIDNKLTIGRKKDNLLVLTDRFVSSYHVKIYLKNNEYIIADLDSTNGTFINSKRIKGKKIIHVGDDIKIGTVLLKVIG
jgi:pSer/pThr/pTyr-binding forkhead associated (FHA) protein